VFTAEVTGGQFTHFSVHDVRFPTSLDNDGSDALDADPDYSSAYVVVHTSAGDRGHVVGRGVKLSVDANQAWERDEAIAWVAALAPYDVHWVEEPTSPDDVLAHAAIVCAVDPIRVATGEHVANRVMFKQFLAAGAIGVCQVDACRVAGVNENLAILLLAAKFGVPVCPHAGGVGLCEVVQHLSMFDYVAVSGSSEGRWIEYVDHLHEHFENPARESVVHFSFPDGPAWSR
jgi:L-fuconate dehydratase